MNKRSGEYTRPGINKIRKEIKTIIKKEHPMIVRQIRLHPEAPSGIGRGERKNGNG